jgi:pyruvate dehydrogenase E2 component (dihydrolipoamide acetyltransferase)
MSDVRDFLLPDLGEGLEDAEVITWRVAEGDSVTLNQVLVEVNTAKALVEIPSPWAGVIERLHAGEGDVVRVGAPLISVRVGGEGAAGPPPPSTEPAAETGPDAAAEETTPRRRAVLVGYGVEEDEPPLPAASAVAAPERAGPVPATPPVRRLAKDLGIDLRSLRGTGPNGRVRREDVMAASESGGRPGGRPAAEGRPAARMVRQTHRIPVRGVRRLIAEKMARSAREIPQVTTFQTVDCSALMGLRDHLGALTGERISPLAIVIAALLRVIDDHPMLNASFDADADGGPQIVVQGRRNVGVAADTPQGLLVPVLQDADRMGIGELAAAVRRVAEAARAGRATPDQLAGGTITVSNVGSFGAEAGTPIINHPEGAILAIGVIEPRALVVDGRVEARPAMTLSLAFDHRLMDGAEAGRALRALKDLLENPFELGSLPR